MRRARTWGALAAVLAFAAARSARADDNLSIVSTNVDPPTVITLGVQVLISGDDNADATIDVGYRKAGSSAVFAKAMPLWRVPDKVVQGRSVAPQFAGSIFDLAPGTSYEIQLHAHDPDGFDKTWTVTAKTRPIPRDPKAPHPIAVTDGPSLQSALAAAKAGDVITLANGTYPGLFTVDGSGTADQPIVIRGASTDGVILDGQGCTGCNVWEFYGDFVHLESMTIQNADRAIRAQKQGGEGLVLRRLHIRDTTLAFGSKPDQKDFYLCDNKLEGRLRWPAVWGDDSGVHANDDGFQVMGTGHVVCHNDIQGYGDAMKSEQDGARGIDFYGNEVRYTYDNAVELDGSEGNTRAFRNRFTNCWSPLSFQPIYGGPAYAFRNVIVNVADEQAKLHSEGGTETVGVLLHHNTWVSPKHALNLQTPNTAHWFVEVNDLWIGPKSPPDGKIVDWSAPVDHGVIDYGGFYADGLFDFGAAGKWASFAEMKAGGVFEAHGVLLDANTFANGLAPPPDYTTQMDPQDANLGASSKAIDQGLVIPNLNDGFTGKAPDLGALEKGCAQPIYGVRPEGTDESNEPIGCTSNHSSGSGGAGAGGGSANGGGTSGGGHANGAGGGDAGSSDSGGGCGCEVAGEEGRGASALVALALALAISSRRSERRAARRS